MAIELDPFTKVFNALWELVDASKPLQRLVSPGNFIRYNKATDRDPFKKEIQTADLPELFLLGSGSSDENLLANSCSSTITRRYSFLLSTGDMRITQFLYPVQFGLYCALASWDSVLRPLKWKNNLYVTNTNWIGMSEGLSNPDANRGIKGWSAVWACKVVMHFKTIDLQAYNDV